MTKLETRTLLRVFATLRLPSAVERELEQAFQYHVLSTASPLDELNALTRAGTEFDFLLCGSVGTRLDAAAIAGLPRGIRGIATYSAGLEHIDLDAARRRGLAVFNTSGALAESVADTALFLMLGAMRRATENIDLIRSRNWPGWHPDQLLGYQLTGKTLGIYGMGEIGAAVALRARACGMAIAYHNRRARTDLDARFIPDAEDLIRESDVLLLAAPSTSNTRGFINVRTLSLAKPTLVVVNVARGDLVIDDDLIAALRESRIFAVGLDVFNAEPALDPRYLDLPNAFLTPHMGSSTFEARVLMGRRLELAIIAFANGERPDNQVV